MPITVTKRSGADSYPNVFVGALGPTVAIDVDLSNLTSDEIDAFGSVKPGVPLTAAGALLAVDTISTVAAGVAHQNAAVTVGNGTIGAATGGFDQPSETITITLTAAGATAAFSVDGDKSGHIGVGAVGTAFVSEQINVLISDGSTDWAALNTITFAVTAGADDRVYGVTVEAVKCLADNADATIAAAGVVQLAVAVGGLVNRDVVEDVLGRSLTAAEVNGFGRGGLQITNT